ncbi:MAG: hypothetical protein FJX62_16000 [Alphaproteobacteria bacterium]|nr:hypothetical protein [Alphaproteobacteria bacterium]
MQNESSPILRSLRAARLCVAVLAAGVLLAQPASAFTVEGGDTNWAPKFNLEEQARQFRSPNSNALPDTRDGGSSRSGLYFGVDRNTSPFNSPFGLENRSRMDRQHYDRMFDPSYQFNSR